MRKEAFIPEQPILAATPPLPDAGWHRLYRNGTSLFSVDSAGVVTSYGGGVSFPITIAQGGTGQITAVAGKDALTVKGADIASAATANLAAATGDFVDVTGAVTITALGTAAAGVSRVIRFTGALILTHNATSLILPRGVNITTRAGDTATFRSLGGGNWLCITFSRIDEASFEIFVAAPGSTTSVAGVMAGLAAIITPRKSGRVLATISGDCRNTTNVKGVRIQPRYGTGAAPSFGGALVGTTKGLPTATIGASNTNRLPFSRTVLLTGLTVGTAVWFDISFAVNNSGTAFVENLVVVLVEL